MAASSKNYRYSTNLMVVIDANGRLVVAIALPLPGSRNDCQAFTESGIDRSCRGAPTIAGWLPVRPANPGGQGTAQRPASSIAIRTP